MIKLNISLPASEAEGRWRQAGFPFWRINQKAGEVKKRKDQRARIKRRICSRVAAPGRGATGVGRRKIARRETAVAAPTPSAASPRFPPPHPPRGPPAPAPLTPMQR